MEHLTKDPFVSVVMPNWNGKDDTLECLDSLRRLDYPHDRLEIIIVDNGSEDGSAGAIRNKYEQMKTDGFFSLRLIELSKNMGAPAAINKGIQSAHPDYDYILKLDNDVILDRDCLRRLTTVTERDSRIGISGPKVLYYQNTDLIQSVGADINLWRGLVPSRGCGTVDSPKYKLVEEVDYICGAGMLVRKEVVRKIGMLDETYFVYFDETDWSMRAWRAGLKVVCVPEAKIWHKQSVSTQKVSGFLLYHMSRSRIIFERKHASLLQYLFFNLYTWGFEYPRVLLSYLNRDRQLVKPFLRGIWEGYSTTIGRNQTSVEKT